MMRALTSAELPAGRGLTIFTGRDGYLSSATESGGERCRFLQGCIVGGIGFSRRHMADRLEKPAVVEPVDPFERGVLDGLQRSPRSAPMDHLGLVEPVDRLGERIVVAVADACRRTAQGRPRPIAPCT